MKQAQQIFNANDKQLERVNSTAATGDYALLLYKNGMPKHMAYGRRTATNQFYIDDIQLNQRFIGDEAVTNYLRRYQRTVIYRITDM